MCKEGDATVNAGKITRRPIQVLSSILERASAASLIPMHDWEVNFHTPPMQQCLGHR
jgi:hypothetical protein